MLAGADLMKEYEQSQITKVLVGIYDEIFAGTFTIEEGIEDIHSQLEKILVDKLGETGKKVHTARSRNDQVLVALKLFYREDIIAISILTNELVINLLERAETSTHLLMPGYTHLQAAMTSSFGLWFSAWAEALTEDLYILRGAMDYVNMNPLGSAAGYGSSFPIDREYTTQLLEFENLHVNSINAQLSRGKTEKILLAALSAIAGDLSKMSMDLVLFLNQNFDFVALDDELTTGSSIMPHKKNPDVLELLRAKANRIQSREFEILALVNNLPSGYHRDYQLLKEICFPAIEDLKECLEMMAFIIPRLKLKENIIEKDIYKYLGSVDAINQKVISGQSFREAYREVASEIASGKFEPVKGLSHSHTGSIGNLALPGIVKKLERIMNKLKVEKYIGFQEKFIQHCKKEGI
jgi:argininosuccinate lyase